MTLVGYEAFSMPDERGWRSRQFHQQTCRYRGLASAAASLSRLNARSYRLIGTLVSDPAPARPRPRARQCRHSALSVRGDVGRCEVESVGSGVPTVAHGDAGHDRVPSEVAVGVPYGLHLAGPGLPSRYERREWVLQPGVLFCGSFPHQWDISAKVPASNLFSVARSTTIQRWKNSSRASDPHAVVVIRSSSWRNVGYFPARAGRPRCRYVPTRLR